MASILYVWKSPFPWDVRAEKICTSLADAGYEVIMLSRWEPGQLKTEKFKNFIIERVGFGKPWKTTTPLSINPVWHNAIRNAIDKYNIKLIIPREIMLASACAKEAAKKEIPVVLDMAEHYPAAMKLWKKYKKNLLKRAFVHFLNIPEKVEEIAVPKMNGIITVCEEQNKRLHDQYGYQFQNMMVVHNTPDLKVFEDVRLGSFRNPVVFGHHGYVTAEKNLDTLVEGFLIAAKYDNVIRLYLAGDGDCLNDLKQIADRSPYSDRVTFQGAYSYAKLNKFLSTIDVGVIPYAANDFNNYTLHNKIFDFMACGKPVIVSNTIPYKRLIEETHCGIVTDCSNPQNIADTILEMRSSDMLNYSLKSLNAAYLKYTWSYDSINLLKFVSKFIK